MDEIGALALHRSKDGRSKAGGEEIVATDIMSQEGTHTKDRELLASGNLDCGVMTALFIFVVFGCRFFIPWAPLFFSFFQLVVSCSQNFRARCDSCQKKVRAAEPAINITVRRCADVACPSNGLIFK